MAYEGSKLIPSSSQRSSSASRGPGQVISGVSMVSRNGRNDDGQINGSSHVTTTYYDPSMSDYGSAAPTNEYQSPISNETSAKSIVLGGIDGITASYVIISAATGANLHWSYFVILGFSNILANSVSIGVSEFFSSKLHRDFILAEKRRATWQYKNFRDEEVQEMTRRLERRGMSHQDAQMVVGKFAIYEDIFVNFLLVEELGMNLPDEDDGASLSDAFVMLLSYAIFGVIPVLVYLLGVYIQNSDHLFMIASAASGVILMILGSVKSSFSSSYWLYTAVETVFTTAVCAGVAYFLAFSLSEALSEYL